jgi:lipopolysaccharide transport system ATP-binding protein
MRDVASQEGRTVLFVSHNMQAVQSLCSSAIHIDAGRVVAQGPAQAIVAEYLAQGTSTTGEKTWPLESAPGDERCRLKAIRVRAGDRPPGGVLPSRETMRVEMDFTTAVTHPGLCVGFDLTNGDGITVFRSYQTDCAPENTPAVQVGENRWVCDIPAGLLNGGLYFISPRIGIHNVAWISQLDPVIEFEVLLDHAVSPFWHSLSGASRPGLVAPILTWRTRS